MHIRVHHGSITDIAADALVVNLFEGVTEPGGATGAVNQALDGLISRLIADGEIKGKHAEVTVLHPASGVKAKRVAVVGLGQAGDFTLTRVRQAAGAAARALAKRGVKTMATIVHGAGIGGLDPADAARATVEGTLLGVYETDLYKTSDREPSALTECVLVEHDAKKAALFTPAAAAGEAAARATNLARTLQNEPPNRLTPTLFAERARAVGKESGIETKVLGPAEIAQLKMGALQAVAQGSQEPAQVVVMQWNGAKTGPRIGLIGKGVTFDSGGLSLKTGEGMMQMKYDMSGAAGVLGAMQLLAALKAPVRVLAVMPLTENLPSGTATRPGDVVTALNGKTIEILNTDAEGRLILADALAYAAQEGCDILLDAATLTGACAVALGPVSTGVLGNDQAVVDAVLAAGVRTGEPMWQLPMFREYRELLKSDIADVKNIGGREGGAITAAKFLEEFVGDARWAHLDIAPTAWSDDAKPWLAKGPTGVPTRTLVEATLALSA